MKFQGQRIRTQVVRASYYINHMEEGVGLRDMQYDEFIRNRITQLRLERNVSEHRMSLDLTSVARIFGELQAGGLCRLSRSYLILLPTLI